EYMLAAHALNDQPSTEEFMLIADGADLNPTMIVRWQAYLNRRTKKHDPVFAPWQALTELPQKEFAAKVQEALAPFSKPDPKKPLNALFAKAYAGAPPGSLKEAAQRYADLFNQLDAKWQKGAAKLDAAEEELRQVFYAADAPPSVAMLPYGSLSLLPDRPSQAVFQKLKEAMEKW